MSDLDEGRDLHAAFGTLLVDEPAAPWSVSDDVTRGRALQRRRRTRAGAGVGLAAAVVMVFGVFGPLRPHTAAVVPPAFSPPAVQGVDQAWLDSLSRSFTAVNATAVDWTTSTVTSTSDGGFALDLNLVGVTVTTGGEDFTVEYPPLPAPTVSRALVTWKPRGGTGPVLASCAAPECSRAEPSVSPGFSEEGGRWDSSGAQITGSFVVDHTFDAGGMLEIATSPVVKDGVVVAKDWATLDYGGIRIVLDRVGRPTGDGTPPNDQFGVTSLLMDLGWTVDGVTVQRVPLGQPAEISWAVHRTGSDANAATGRLTIRTWDERSWNPGEGAIDPASVIASCAKSGACSNVASSIVDCVSATGCWSTSAATTLTSVGAAPARSYILYAYNEGAQHAVEAVVEPLSPVVPCMDTGFCQRSGSFLDEQETAQVVEVVKKQLDASPSPSPSVTPTTPASDDAVTRTLEGFGMRVKSVFDNNRGANVVRVYDVDVDLTADNPVGAQLTITRFAAADVSLGTERVAVDGSAMNSCTSTTCTPLTNVTFPCPTSYCFQDWWAITTPAYTGYDQGTLIVFRADGTNAVEAVVGVKNCPTCGQTAGSGSAFLTLEQAQEVLTAFGLPRGGTVPGPSATPAVTRPCAPEDVKLIPGAGVPDEVTGGRGNWIEVHARNPEVDCIVSGVDSVSLVDASGASLAFRYRAGVYQLRDFGDGPVEVSQAVGPARFALSKYRCDEAPAVPAATAYVTLDGWTRPVGVELPAGSAGVEQCPGGLDAAGNTVYVSGVVRPG